MVTKFNDQWEIEDDFDSDSDLYSNLEVDEYENDDDFESFFSSQEIEKLRDKFKEFARKANEFGKPTIIKTYLEMLNR